MNVANISSGAGLTNLSVRENPWDDPTGFGLVGVSWPKWTQDAANTVSNGVQGLGTVVENTVTNVVTNVVGAAEGIGQGVSDFATGFVSVLAGIADGDLNQVLLGFQTMIRGIFDVATITITTSVSLVLDFIAELRGEWEGRKLNSGERQLLRQVFGHDINLSAIKIIMNDGTTQNGRAHVHGTTIHWPDNTNPLSTGTIASFVHEATHIVQKQAFFYDVVGRTAVPQVIDFLSSGGSSSVPEHDWLAGPPPHVPGELYSPRQFGDNNEARPGDIDGSPTSMRTILFFQRAEAHATMVQQYFIFLKLLEHVEAKKTGTPGVPLISPLDDQHVSRVVLPWNDSEAAYDTLVSRGKDANDPNSYTGWFYYTLTMKNAGWFQDWL